MRTSSKKEFKIKTANNYYVIDVNSVSPFYMSNDKAEFINITKNSILYSDYLGKMLKKDINIIVNILF